MSSEHARTLGIEPDLHDIIATLTAQRDALLAACQKAQAEFRNQKRFGPKDHTGFCGCGVCNNLDSLEAALASCEPAAEGNNNGV